MKTTIEQRLDALHQLRKQRTADLLKIEGAIEVLTSVLKDEEEEKKPRFARKGNQDG